FTFFNLIYNITNLIAGSATIILHRQSGLQMEASKEKKKNYIKTDISTKGTKERQLGCLFPPWQSKGRSKHVGLVIVLHNSHFFVQTHFCSMKISEGTEDEGNFPENVTIHVMAPYPQL
ncbi:hypothetical protein ACJX0J_030695, partial [Zea mays]